MLTVKQLKELLENASDNAIITLATEDPEWNDRYFYFAVRTIENIVYKNQSHFLISSEKDLPFRHESTDETEDDFNNESILR